MTVRGIPAIVLLEALGRLAVRRVASSQARLRRLFYEDGGRKSLTSDERRLAVVTDAFLARLRVQCLWRAVVITDMLRSRDVAARVRLSVAGESPREAHAVVEVGEEVLHWEPEGSVVLR